jgi:hypothetical protein
VFSETETQIEAHVKVAEKEVSFSVPVAGTPAVEAALIQKQVDEILGSWKDVFDNRVAMDCPFVELTGQGKAPARAAAGFVGSKAALPLTSPEHTPPTSSAPAAR